MNRNQEPIANFVVGSISAKPQIYRDSRGAEFARKPGRPKLLDEVTASLLFEAQVQKRAAERRIEKLLDARGISTASSARNRLLKQNFEDRGRIDVIHPKPARRQS